MNGTLSKPWLKKKKSVLIICEKQQGREST